MACMQVLLELKPDQHQSDNFEGIAVVESAAGARVLLVSDNNFRCVYGMLEHAPHACMHMCILTRPPRLRQQLQQPPAHGPL